MVVISKYATKNRVMREHHLCPGKCMRKMFYNKTFITRVQRWAPFFKNLMLYPIERNRFLMFKKRYRAKKKKFFPPKSDIKKRRNNIFV